MTTLIHRREVADPILIREQNSTILRREGEFAAILQRASEKKRPSPVSKEERIQQAVTNASQKYDLPPSLILAIIKQESHFNPEAESPTGAQGLMQLMPGTAREMGVTHSFDIDQNVDGGSRYMRQMLDQFGGDVRLALAAYNAGPTRVGQYNGIPPLEETMNYVPSVLDNWAHYESFNGSPALNVVSSKLLDLNLMISAAASTKIAATPVIPMPEIKKSNGDEEPPPPPPPTAVRV